MGQEISLANESIYPQTNGQPDSDLALVSKMLTGNGEAWTDFYQRYLVWIYRFAYYNLGRRHADAEDLCSEILMTAAKGISNFDSKRGNLDAWVLGVAKDSLRRFCRRRSMEILSDARAIDLNAPSTGSDEEALRRIAVNRALACLPERQASALVDKYVGGYSTEELASMNGTTPKAMESLLTRARESFRTALTRLFDHAERRR